jgi:hypothetical protein
MTQHSSISSGKKNSVETDFLAELAGEATQKVQVIASEEEVRLAQAASLHSALNQLFKYLNQFFSHVNKIKPAIPRAYGSDIQFVYDALQWAGGSADYRKQSLADNALLDHVLLRIQMTNTTPIKLKRRWHQIGVLKKELHAFGLQPINELDALLQNLPQQEFFHVELKPEFQIRMHFQGNYDTGAVDLLCTNLEDFGVAAYTLKPEEVTPMLLDELGRFLIGRNAEPPKLLSRSHQISQQTVTR